MKLSRVFLFLLVLACSSAFAQGYPNKPVRIIVPFPAGGTTDIVARIVAQKLTETWGQSVIVENRTGAGGNIGGEAAARSTPDGYTLFMTSGSIVTANQYIYKKMPFDPTKDLVPITNVASGPQVIVVNSEFPAKTLRQFIDAARAQPGVLNYGHAGIGSQTHLAAENFLFTADLNITSVPYKGEGPAMNDLIGKQLSMVTANFAAAIGFINQGKLRALAVTGTQRSPQLPDVPTVAETLPGFENTGWFGLMVAAGTPKEIIDKIYRDTVKILGTVELRARFYALGMVPVGNTPAEFADAIREESAHWAKVVHERKIVVN
ncbi:MAG TPA: tripartite tricarboxylate transporter substrate binding protein [Burkholderiales bacterium]